MKRQKRTRVTVYDQTVRYIHQAREYSQEIIDVCNEFCEERCSRVEGDACAGCPGARLDSNGERSGECVVHGLGDTLDEIITLMREADEMEANE